MQRPTQKEHLKRVLTRERNRRELTQEQVAEAIGVSVRNYQRWEKGQSYPQPYYLQQLREYFGPCIDEKDISFHGSQSNTQFSVNDEKAYQSSSDPAMSSEKAFYKLRWSSIFWHARNYQHLRLFVGLSILILAMGMGYVLYITHPFGFGPVKPGGEWISPVGPTVGDIVYFAAYAYPNHPTDPAIDYVNFTAYWPGVDPRAWKIVCHLRIPVRKDVYACDVNLKQLGAPPGQISISFDVYDVQGNVHLAPNGEHKIMYVSGS